VALLWRGTFFALIYPLSVGLTCDVYFQVDAQNKFMGKSFEIRPTGIAHAELIIPEERGGPGYPKAPGKAGEGKVVEHYSWKKVTTNVSGFILGSPTIDHYGDMIVCCLYPLRCSMADCS